MKITEPNPSVSVITVVRNGEKMIEKTIQSVLYQTFDKVEYIIIDGKSTDNTMEIVNKYSNKIDVIISEPDLGIYDAMNKGIDVAKGEWLNFMNCGDVFSDPQVLYNIFQNSTIPSDVEFIYSDWSNADFKHPEKIKKKCTAILKKGYILHQSSIYKKSLHIKYGKYLVTPKLIASDYVFFSLIPHNTFYKTNIPIAIYDINGISNQGSWCYYQKLIVDYLFYRISLNQLLRSLIWVFLKHRVKKILKFIR